MEELGNYYLNKTIDNNGVAPIQGLPSLSKRQAFIEDTPFKGPIKTGPLTGEFFERNSKYDKTLGSVDRMLNENMSSDEARAEVQSTLNRIGNALVNNAVIAGTTAVSGTLSFTYGIFDALANGELSRLYDNPINKEMLEWQEGIAKISPNYYKKGYEESSIWNKLGTSIFWADLIKNLGYAEGMMIPGMGASKILQNVPKAAQVVGSSLYGSISEASIEALQAKQDKLDLDSKIAYKSYLNDINSGANITIAQDKYIDALNDAENDANGAGNFVLGYNIALLTATNALEWGKLFSRGNNFSRRKMLESARSQNISIVSDVEKQLPKLAIDNKLLFTAKNIATRLGKASTEGLEEVMQGVGVTAADLNPKYNDFNENVYNQDYRELASNTIQSIGMALSEAVKDPETYTNFAMGFFTGALGIPTLQNPKTETGYRLPITMEGGIKEFFEEQSDYNKKVKLVNEVNTRLENDPNIEEYYKGLVRSSLLEDKANTALELNDTFNFNNYQYAQLISDVIMFDNVGHIDVLQDIINKANNFSNQEIQELIDQGVFEDGKNTPSIKEVKDKISKNANKLNTVLESYLKDKELIESQKGDLLSKEAIENILYAKSQIKDWQDRSKSISEELYNTYNNLSPNTISKNEFVLALTLSSKFKEDVKKLNTEELTADIAEDLNKKIDDIIKIERSIENFTAKINEDWNNTDKANGTIEKIKNNAVKKAKVKKVKSLKDKLQNLTSVSELREFINSTQDSNINDAIDELYKDKNLVVATYKEILNTRDNIESKIRELKRDEQTTEDALFLLNNASTIVEDSLQLQDLELELYNDISLLGEEDATIAADRIIKAKELLKQAFIGSNTELNEIDSVTEDIVFDMNLITDSDISNDIIDFEEVGHEGSSKAVAVNTTDVTDVEEVEIKESPNTSSDTSSASDILNATEQVNNEEDDTVREEWNPAISEYHRESIKKGKYISTAKADSRFKEVWNYLYQNNAFDFVNKGKLKVGDDLYFGLVLNSDSEWIKNSIFVFVKTDLGYQVLNTLYLSGQESSLKDKILEEYNNSNKEDNKDIFISSFKSKVSSLKTGVIVQDEVLRPLSQSLEGTDITSDNVILSVIKGVRKDTGNYEDKNNEITTPNEIENKNGWTYIEIPNVKKGTFKGRTAMPLVVADYGKQIPIEGKSFENTGIYRRIQNSIKSLASADNAKDLKTAFEKLQNDITVKKLSVFLTKDGDLRINKRVFDSNGNPIKVLVNNKFVEKQIPHTIKKTNANGTPRLIEVIISEIDDLLKSMNLRFRTNADYLNTPSYNKELIESGILSSYLVKAEERSAWFTIEPITTKKQVDTVEKISISQKENADINTEDLDLDTLMGDFGDINISSNVDTSYQSRKEIAKKEVQEKDIALLLNNGYSQKDIDNMSAAEIHQAKQCLGF